MIYEPVQRFPPETRFLIDNSNSVPWSIHYFFHHRPENYHLPTGFASMGWAIGASVGVALGKRNTPVVCFTGDGCFLMSGQEITVAVEAAKVTTAKGLKVFEITTVIFIRLRNNRIKLKSNVRAPQKE